MRRKRAGPPCIKVITATTYHYTRFTPHSQNGEMVQRHSARHQQSYSHIYSPRSLIPSTVAKLPPTLPRFAPVIVMFVFRLVLLRPLRGLDPGAQMGLASAPPRSSLFGKKPINIHYDYIAPLSTFPTTIFFQCVNRQTKTPYNFQTLPLRSLFPPCGPSE